MATRGEPLVVRVQEFDHHSPEYHVHAYDWYSAMRSKCPVGKSDVYGGFWVVTDYATVSSVARDDHGFRSADGVTIPAHDSFRAVIPIEVDPPDFFKYRRFLNPFFAPDPMRRLKPQVEELAASLIEAKLASGEIDFVQEYARVIPAVTTIRLVGLSENDTALYMRNVETLIHQSVYDQDLAIETALEMYAALAIEIDARREGSKPRDGTVLDALLFREVEPGESLSDEQVLDVCFLLLFGGLDTTSAAIGNALAYLDRHHEARERLVREPGLIPTAVEEFLRYEAPVQGLARTVDKRCELAGAQIERGERVWLSWAAANRDEREFQRPDEVVLDRTPNRHLSFGVGIHRCLGAHLARVEFQVALEEVLARTPDYRIDWTGAERWRDQGTVWGYSRLPARLGGGAKGGGAANRAALPSEVG